MSAGLQRRRVGAAASNPDVSIKYSEGKVVASPREDDLDDDKYAPRLTIMEEILLLGLKDKQGYLSFWNDNISYVLRGCILIELSLRNRIAVSREPGRRKPPLSERILEVVDERLTGEVLLDEAIKMMKSGEKLSVGSWIDLMSGETWNVMKIGYQLKQVRERLAKGLVDKGILRTEKRNFLLFDMATHPVSDPSAKGELVCRVIDLLTRPANAIPICSPSPPTSRTNGSNRSHSNSTPPQHDSKTLTKIGHLRTVAMICAAYAANVLENALVSLSHEARDNAYLRVDELLADYAAWPPGSTGPAYGGMAGVGPGGGIAKSESALVGVAEEVEKEGSGREVVAAVLNVFTKMDSIL